MAEEYFFFVREAMRPHGSPFGTAAHQRALNLSAAVLELDRYILCVVLPAAIRKPASSSSSPHRFGNEDMHLFGTLAMSEAEFALQMENGCYGSPRPVPCSQFYVRGCPSLAPFPASRVPPP